LQDIKDVQMRTRHDTHIRLIESLKSLGLTKYEVLVYIALLRVKSATATEIHESSGVPRASVYPVVGQLLDKDLVSVSESVPKRFAASPPKEAIGRLLTRIEHDAKYAIDALSNLHNKRISAGDTGEELIWNIYGIGSIRKKLVDLITSAHKEIRVIAHPQIFSEEVREALTAAAGHTDVEIVTPQWEGDRPDAMKIYLTKVPEVPRELSEVKDLMAGGVCLIDRNRVLVIVGSGDEDAVALFSESEGFVRFFMRYYGLIIDWAKKER
jgi:HTH-type transcriptional regulator, sugar sensing transcriptional regulator